MRKIKVCTAIRDKEYEDLLNERLGVLGYTTSTVNRYDIVNGMRREDLIFIVEDSYVSILNLIEEYNVMENNFLPVIVLTSKDSKYKEWISSVKDNTKYVMLDKSILSYVLIQSLDLLHNLRVAKLKEYMGNFAIIYSNIFSNKKRPFSDALQAALDKTLDFLFAEKGSVMLINDRGNLVIEASTKREIIGIEVPYDEKSVAYTVLNNKEPVFVEDVTKDSRFSKKEERYSKDYFLSVPIFVEGDVKGVFNLSDKKVDLLFDKTDLERLKYFLYMLEPVFSKYYALRRNIVSL